MHRATAFLSLYTLLGSVAAHRTGFAVGASNTEFNIRLGDEATELTRQADTNVLQKRQTCGDGIGACPAGSCCSGAGYCGTTEDYCKGPDCQLEYSGLACDASQPPPGDSTLSIARPQIGSVPYGTIITTCSQDGDLALTFDDGPHNYTNALLDVLDQYSIKATFFICGNNLGKGRIDDESNPWANVLRRMHSAGHQLASHSWTHQDLASVNSTIRQQQVVYNEMAFRNLFGFFPTYLRPPYGDCTSDSGCLTDVTDLGYHVITWNIDTKDYLNDDPNLIQNSKDTFSDAVSNDSSANAYIELSHDIHYETVVNLTAFMIDTLLARGYTPVPIGTCLGDPEANWYRDASDNSSSTTTATSTATSCASTSASATATSSSLVVSPDGTCGGTTGNTCQGSRYGNCCSPYNNCGSSPAYCRGGCQSTFGSCWALPTSPVPSPNGLCGSITMQTCVNSTYGACCSKYGYCGNTSVYCGTGCQSAFGKCT